jgi:hypothetical protein
MDTGQEGIETCFGSGQSQTWAVESLIVVYTFVAPCIIMDNHSIVLKSDNDNM